MSALLRLHILKPHPQVAQQSLKGADVSQGRDVIQAMLARGQQGGGQDGQGGVLGAADLHFSLKWEATFNDDFIHFVSYRKTQFL